MRIVGSFLVLLVFATSVFSNSDVASIDQVLKNLEVDAGFSGNVLIAEKGEIVFEKSYGYSEFNKKKPFTTESLFNIASITKTFTATAFMHLVEQGRVKLSDPLKKYLPTFPHENVTIRHLLTHTSGVMEFQRPDIRKVIEQKGVDNSGLLKAFVEVGPKLDFEPGSKYKYSNTNYTFLALVIEKVSGMSYVDFLNRNIFVKANMNSSYIFDKNIPESKKTNLSDSFYRDGFIKPRWVNALELGFVKRHNATFDNLYGGSKIFTTARDLLKFHEALQSGRLLKKRTLRRMYQPVMLTTGKDYRVSPVPNYPSRQGLAWEVAVNNSDGTIVYHAGGEPGTRSYLMRNVSRDICVVILTNNNLTDHRTFTFPMKAYLGGKYQLEKQSLALAVGKKLYADGSKAGLEKYNELANSVLYRFSEDEFNSLGYELLEADEIAAAIRVFEIVTKRVPKSSNGWDSLGEAYLKAGDKKRALKYYELSIELDPKNESGKAIVKKLKAEM